MNTNKNQDEKRNVTTIMFTNEFREDIKKIQATGLVEKLRYGNLNDLMDAQENIRDYIALHYKKYIRNCFPDYYALMICLVVDIDTFTCWEDFTGLFYPNLPFVGFGEQTIDRYKCCCSHHVTSENTTMVSYKGYYLALGNECILKTSVVSNFKEFKKLKKQQMERNAVTKDILLMQIKTYKTRLVKQYEAYTNLIKQNRLNKNKEYDVTHRICGCGRQCGSYLKCWSCKNETEDKCACNKWKNKKYSKCFTCNKVIASV